jgi:transposase
VNGARGRVCAKTLIDERTRWLQRIRATLFHHGVDGAPERLRTSGGREFLHKLELPTDARERIEIALAMVDSLERRLRPLEAQLRKLARRQAGCRALMGLYGMGELTALVTLTELGDCSACRPRARRCAWQGSTSACIARTAAHESAGSIARAPRSCAGRCMRPRNRPVARAAPTVRTTSR